MAKIEDVHENGTRAAQPTPTADQVGTLYSVSDEGVMERWSGTAWVAVAGTVRKDNLSATTDPDNDDGSGDGYTVGSLWINVTADTVWRCVDATLTLAIWLVLATRTNPYYTGLITTGTTHHIAGADISRNDGAIIKDDGSSGIAIAHWYRLGTFYLVYGSRSCVGQLGVPRHDLQRGRWQLLLVRRRVLQSLGSDREGRPPRSRVLACGISSGCTGVRSARNDPGDLLPDRE